MTRRIRRWFCLIVSLHALCVCGGEPAATMVDAAPLHLAATLTDGSTLMGLPALERLRLITEFALIEVPLEQLECLEIMHDGERATMVLRNGDRLTGVPDLTELRLQALFGAVTVGMEHVVRLSVRSQQSLAGLMLHYSFDHDQDGQVIDGSGRDHHGRTFGNVVYVEQPTGYAVQTSSRDTYVICDNSGLNINGWRQLTVALRVRLNRYSAYGSLISRGNPDINKGGFGIRLGGIYGGSPLDGGVGIWTGDDGGVHLPLERFVELNRWYHLALVYDGHSLAMMVNGVQIAALNTPPARRGHPLWDHPANELMIGKCSVLRSWSDTHIDGLIDDVMIFNRALSVAEIRDLVSTTGGQP